jgi:two-component system chemotaxis response regulator CheB
MSRKPIKVLIVDDSQLIRELMRDSLELQADMSVVGMAADGREALAMLNSLEPDVVTLDLQMPQMGGLETLDQMLSQRPTPVIVVSSFAKRAADVTLQALDRGAMDYVAKPDVTARAQQVFCSELPQKIRNMAGADVRRVLDYRRARQRRAAAVPAQPENVVGASSKFERSCIAIGVSTGGPPALATLFSALTPPLPPIVIVQHMPCLFTGPFANRLNTLSAIEVKEAATGDRLRANWALVAPGGKHLQLVRRGGNVEAFVFDGDPVSSHKPSVDVLMHSAARIYGSHCLGVIMTGMGRDGSDGCGAILGAGGIVLGQDEASSDVYGMNKVAFVEGHVTRQVSLGQLPDDLMATARRIAEP